DDANGADVDALLPKLGVALDAYTKLLAEPGFLSYPTADEVLLRAAMLMLTVNLRDQAHAALDRMLASFPQSAYVGDAYAILARDQSDHGAFDRAHQLYDQAIAVARPTIAEVARLERARVLVSNGEDRAALADCEQVAAAAQSLREVAASTAVD